jgi:Immunity protein Imm1
MNNSSVTIEIEIERAGHPRTVRTGLSVDDVAAVIRGMASEPDVIVTVSRSGVTDERVLLTISGANAYLGLVRPVDEIFEYVARGNEDRRGEKRLMIGSQVTDIESRYIVDIETAVAVVREWLTSGYESSSFGRWEHT